MELTLTLDGLKARMDRGFDGDDEVLQAYLDEALEQAQAPPPHGCGRLLIPDPEDEDDDPVQRRIRAHGGRFVRIPDAREITEVLVDDDVVTDYETKSRNGVIVGLELPDECDAVKVTGRFGLWPIPASLGGAIYILAARSYYEQAAQFADQVEVLEGTAVHSYYRQLPPRTKLAFASFTVPSDVLGAG